MNRKRIIGITATAIALVAVIGVGAWKLLSRKTNVEETTEGNRLGVEWYDADGTEFTINTADELYEFAELSSYYDFKNQTVYLGADIVINDGNAEDWEENAPSRKWTGIKKFAGTFDGQGHTISGLYAKGYNTSIALFTNTLASCHIKNLKLTNSYLESRGFGGVASIASNGGGHFSQIYSDATLNVVGVYSGFSGGICSKLTSQSTIEECWYDGVINTTGRDAGGILDDAYGCHVTISHCLFSGTINSAWDYSGSRLGGLVGRVYKSGAALVLNDSLSVGTINASTIYYTGSVLGVTPSSTSLTATNTYGSMNSYGAAIGRNGSSGNIYSAPIELRQTNLVGTKAYEWTALDFDQYWAIVEDGTPILQCFAQEVPSVEGLTKAFDTSWYSEGATEYVLEDKADLYGFYYMSANTTFSGKTIKLAADIVVNEGKASDWGKTAPEDSWYPIKKFSGTFDGQGHTISGLYLKSDAIEVGMFTKTTMESIIKNFSLKNSYFENILTENTFMGSIVGRGGGTIDTVYSDAIVIANGPQCGGILGQMNLEAKSVITNCWYDGTFQMKGNLARYGGGIVGSAVKGITEITHCLNTGTISSEKDDGGANIGGIIGVTLNADTVLNVEDCFNAGKITTKNIYATGAIIGNVVKGTANVSASFATNESCVPDTTPKTIGNVFGTLNGGAIGFPESMLTGYGAYQWTTLNFSKYWASVVTPDGTPILKSFANKVPSLDGVVRLVDTSWYSADKTEYVLNDMQDLYGLYVMSSLDTFEGKTIKLGADITVNTGNASEWSETAPAYSWLAIKKFAGTFDGQGHTISGLYMKTEDTTIGLFSKTTLTSTIKNLRLTNSYFECTSTGNTFVGSVVGRGGGTLDTIYSDAIVVSAGEQNGGIIGQVNLVHDNKITNCWYNGTFIMKGAVGRSGGGIVGTVVLGSTTISHCLNSGNIISERSKNGSYVGGICGAVLNKGTELLLEDCLNVGTVTMKNKYTAGSILGNNNKGSVTIKSTYATRESCTPWGSPIGVGNSAGTFNGKVESIPTEFLTGTDGYKYTTLDFYVDANDDGYWVARNSATPALKSFVNETERLSVAGITREELTYSNTYWYTGALDDADGNKPGTKENPYLIASAGELFGLAELVNSGKDFKDQYIKLKSDIEVNEDAPDTLEGWKTYSATYDWTPIGSYDSETKVWSYFSGNFDGAGHSISGLYLNKKSNYAGLFAATSSDCTVQNVTVKNSYFSVGNKTQAGAISARGGGNFININVEDVVLTGKQHVGGVIGMVDQRTMVEGCQLDVIVNCSEKYAGGIVGSAGVGALSDSDGNVVRDQLDVQNCKVEGTITATSEDCGGVLGYVTKHSDSINIANCEVNATITTPKNSGGILGYVKECASTTIDITGCKVGGTVTATTQVSGGIIGFADEASTEFTVTCCLVECDVTAKQQSGGVIGNIKTGMLSVSDTLVKGTITGTRTSLKSGQSNKIGGICGYLGNKTATLNVNKCLVLGSIVDAAYATCETSVGVVVGESGSDTSLEYKHVYYKTECCANGASGKVAGNVTSESSATSLIEEQLKGDNALTHASALFEGDTPTWVTVTDSTPIPAVFAEEKATE